MKTLEQIHHEPFDKVSDKWEIYLREYDRLFTPLRTHPVSLLEIGIQNGGSLERWAAYFEHAISLIGCDINPDCGKLIYKDPRIKLIVGDANEPATVEQITNASPAFDIVIDDGSHRSGDIVRAFANFFPSIVNGGMFIAEDLHCSYWNSFEGGLFHPHSSIAFFKRLADVINHEHWGVGLARSQLVQDFCEAYQVSLSEELLSSVHSVEFINSICVVRKDVCANNELGRRLVCGSSSAVMPVVQSLAGMMSIAPDQEIEVNPLVRSDDDLQHRLLQTRVSDLKKELGELRELAETYQRMVSEQAQSAQLTQEKLDAVYSSRSWRMTAGLRRVAEALRSATR